MEAGWSLARPPLAWPGCPHPLHIPLYIQRHLVKWLPTGQFSHASHWLKANAYIYFFKEGISFVGESLLQLGSLDLASKRTDYGNSKTSYHWTESAVDFFFSTSNMSFLWIEVSWLAAQDIWPYILSEGNIPDLWVDSFLAGSCWSLNYTLRFFLARG